MKTRTRYINKLEELGALVNQLSEKTVLDVRAAGRALAGDADAAESVLSGSKAARRLREAIEDGRADFTPCSFARVPRMFHSFLPVDVALVADTLSKAN